MTVIKEIEKGKKSRKEAIVAVMDQLIFEGSELPSNTDFNAVGEGTPFTFQENACFNLIGKQLIEESGSSTRQITSILKCI